MSLSEIHNICALKANTTVIGGITDSRAFANSQVRGDASDGEIFPPVAYMFAQNPGGQFKSRNLKAVIDLLDAVTQTYAFTGAGFNVYGQKHAEGGGRASGSAHRQISAARGMLVPRRISAAHRQEAMIDFDAIVAYNGSANPWAITDSAALPTGADDSLRYTLGHVVVGGVTIDALTSIEIDFGFQAQSIGADSEIWDRHSSVFTAQPRIMIRGINVKKWIESGGIPLAGLAAELADTAIVFRKYDGAGGTFIADGTAEHIALQCAGIIVPQDLIGGSNGKPQEVSFELKLRNDGSNNTFEWDTTAAIS